MLSGHAAQILDSGEMLPLTL